MDDLGKKPAEETEFDLLCHCPICRSVFSREEKSPTTRERVVHRYCPWDGHELYPLVGSVLGSYLLEAHLGRGGFAVVYRGAAVDNPEIKKAVKVLLPSPLLTEADSEVFLEDSMKMHQASAGGSWPNIPGIDVPHREPWPHFAMDLVGGPPLTEILKEKGHLPVDEARTCLRGIAWGLKAVHSAGLLHADLKPGNIRLSEGDVPREQDRPKLLDFGIALSVRKPKKGDQVGGSAQESDDESGITPGQVAGTLEYMAPEAFEGRPDFPRTDFYSFGIMAYQLLTGSFPFMKPDAAAAVTMPQRFRAWQNIHCSQPPRAFPKKPQKVPRRLRALCEACLEKDPKRRPRDDDQLLSYLKPPWPLWKKAAALVLTVIVVGSVGMALYLGIIDKPRPGGVVLSYSGTRRYLIDVLEPDNEVRKVLVAFIRSKDQDPDRELVVESWVGKAMARELEFVLQPGSVKVSTLTPMCTLLKATQGYTGSEVPPFDKRSRTRGDTDEPRSKLVQPFRVVIPKAGETSGCAAYEVRCDYTGQEDRGEEGDYFTNSLYLIVHFDADTPSFEEVNLRAQDRYRSDMPFEKQLNRGDEITASWKNCTLDVVVKDVYGRQEKDVNDVQLLLDGASLRRLSRSAEKGSYSIGFTGDEHIVNELSSFTLRATDEAGNAADFDFTLKTMSGGTYISDEPMFTSDTISAFQPAAKAWRSKDTVSLMPASGTIAQLRIVEDGESSTVEYRTSDESDWLPWGGGDTDSIVLDGKANLQLRFDRVYSDALLEIQHAVVGSRASRFPLKPWKPPEKVDFELTFLYDGRAEPLPYTRPGEGTVYQIMARHGERIDVTVRDKNVRDVLAIGKPQIPEHWVRDVDWEWDGHERRKGLELEKPFTFTSKNATLRVWVNLVREAPPSLYEFDLFFCERPLKEVGIEWKPRPQLIRDPQNVTQELGVTPEKKEFKEELDKAVLIATGIYGMGLFGRENQFGIYSLCATDKRLITVTVDDHTFPAGSNWVSVEPKDATPLKDQKDRLWSHTWEVTLSPPPWANSLFCTLAIDDGLPDGQARYVCALGRYDNEDKITGKSAQNKVLEPVVKIDIGPAPPGIPKVQVEKIEITGEDGRRVLNSRLSKPVILDQSTCTKVKRDGREPCEVHGVRDTDMSDRFTIDAEWEDDRVMLTITMREDIFPVNANCKVYCRALRSFSSPDDWKPVYGCNPIPFTRVQRSYANKVPLTVRGGNGTITIPCIRCEVGDTVFYAMQTEVTREQLKILCPNAKIVSECEEEGDTKPTMPVRGLATLDDVEMVEKAARQLGASLPTPREWEEIFNQWQASVDFDQELVTFGKLGDTLVLDRELVLKFLSDIGVVISETAPREVSLLLPGAEDLTFTEAAKRLEEYHTFVGVVGNVAEIVKDGDTYRRYGMDYDTLLPSDYSVWPTDGEGLRKTLQDRYALPRFDYGGKAKRCGLRLVLRKIDEEMNRRFWDMAKSGNADLSAGTTKE